MQFLQPGAGLDPELVEERAARVLVGAQRFRLATCAIEREQLLCSEPLAQRVLDDERLDLADHAVVVAECDLGVDQLLLCNEVQLLEPRRLVLRERLVCHLDQGRPPPQLEGCAQELCTLSRLFVPRRTQVALEPERIDLFRLDPEDVSGRTRDERVAEQSP